MIEGEKMSEFVYILTNPSIPDLVKIGKTTNIKKRMRSLSGPSGVPLPFECYYCCEVKNMREVEKRLHIGLGDPQIRINPKREFFRISPERVKVLLEPYSIREVVVGEDVVKDPEERKSLNRERLRRPVFTFSMLDIPTGSKLTFVRDETKIVTVTGDREVEFEGNRTSLNQVTLDLLRNDHGKNWSTVRGPDYWSYENEILTDRRLRMEGV